MSRQLYARVFTQILDSSLAEDWQTRHVFEDLLKLADDGLVDMTRQAIARRTNVPLVIINAALDRLESPDPASRDASEDGRRIVRLDGHRDWGWRIVNWDRYEAIRSVQDVRDQARERKRRQRERRTATGPSPAPLPAEAEAEAEAAGQNVTVTKGHAASVTERDAKGRKGSAVASPASKVTDSEWLAGLKADPVYVGIDVDREHGKMLRWCETNQKTPSRRRFVNWLNRCDRPMSSGSTSSSTGGQSDGTRF